VTARRGPLVSFLIPARNAAAFLGATIASLQDQRLTDWEAIVVDDHSSDDTWRVLTRASAGDPRIRPIRNDGRGIVPALNAAHRAARGSHLKFIDADDVLTPEFSDRIEALTRRDATYHDLEIVTEELRIIAPLRLTSRFADGNYLEFIKPGVVSPPRCTWTFSRGTAERVFPLPAELQAPHEDYWLAMAFKRNARSLGHVDARVYLYRQHATQLFGGIYNFGRDVVTFRAQAMLGVIDIMEQRERAAGGDPRVLRRLSAMRGYYAIAARPQVSVRQILGAPLSRSEKTKLLITRKAPRVASLLSRLKSRVRASQGTWK
jgi:glycosyltransferase involved in cell wall biosynthesis